MATHALTSPAELRRDGAVHRLLPTGDWTMETLASQSGHLDNLDISDIRHLVIDASEIGKLDTAGAYALARFGEAASRAGAHVEWSNLPEHRVRLVERVERALDDDLPEVPPNKGGILRDIGQTTLNIWSDAVTLLSMTGELMHDLGRSFLHPSRFRAGAMVKQIEMTGVRAMPIVLLMSFIIGAILAQQGAFQLRFFGAEIFVVDLVGILALREICVVLTAVMVAGRSGSAITAEIGSMQMREEIDALRVIGMRPMEVLVLPRIVALLIVLPLLTFSSALASLIGAVHMAWRYVDIPPNIFILRLRDAIDFSSLFSGLIKAPFMALIIGLIACAEGLAVRGSAESLGAHTTASVVKSIFMVIVVDGIFAVFYAAIDF